MSCFVNTDKTDSELYVEEQKTQNSQHNIEQNQNTNITQLQDLA